MTLPPALRLFLRFSFLVFPFSFVPGCAILGVAAQALPPPIVEPKYTNLANQSVGVMVWADRGIRIDWPRVQLDLANAIQKKLSDEKKAKTLAGTTYPVLPASIVRYQKDHPEIEAMPIADVAPKLGVGRLIYVELEDFATRSDMSVDLFRGHMKSTVRVIEIGPDGKATVGMELNNVETAFPPKVPREGIPNAGDQRIYAGLIDAAATDIARLFFPWRPEEHQ